MKMLKSVIVAILALVGFLFFPATAWTWALILGVLSAVSIAIWIVQKKKPRQNWPSSASGIAKRVFLSVWAGLGLCFVLMLGLALTGEWDRSLRENENRALVSLKNLATAQVTFAIKEYHTVPGNNVTSPQDGKYADNFRNLHYGRDGDGRQLRLIPRELADAFVVENILNGAKTADNREHNPSAPCNGYYFQEDVTELPRTLEHAQTFAYMAFPAFLKETGRYVFWIGEEGTVYRHEPDAPKRTPAAKLMELYRNRPGSSPLSNSPTLVWTEYP